MRKTLAILGFGLGVLFLSPRAEACSIRGQYCGYPSWAANIFEGRYGFKGNPSILTDYYVGQPPRKVVRVSRTRGRR